MLKNSWFDKIRATDIRKRYNITKKVYLVTSMV